MVEQALLGAGQLHNSTGLVVVAVQRLVSQQHPATI
jgi:hypothetical protein